jgi:hypothetical protein
MDRALGIIVTLLLVCLVLPTLTRYATQAVPLLASLLALLLLIRLAAPSGGRRR